MVLRYRRVSQLFVVPYITYRFKPKEKTTRKIYVIVKN